MRVHGSMRLVLNTKIWAQMTVDRASKKSIRVSAQTGDGDIGVFLITVSYYSSPGQRGGGNTCNVLPRLYQTFCSGCISEIVCS